MSQSHSSWSDLPPFPVLPQRLSSLLYPSRGDEHPPDPWTAGPFGRLATQSPIALGARITFDGHFKKEPAERDVSAWRLFYSLRHLLCDDRVALKHRLRLFSSCVVSSLYWCAGSWMLTRSQCTHLRALHNKMLRRMICASQKNQWKLQPHTYDALGASIAAHTKTGVPGHHVLCTGNSILVGSTMTSLKAEVCSLHTMRKGQLEKIAAVKSLRSRLMFPKSETSAVK